MKKIIETLGDLVKEILKKDNKKVLWLAEELGYKDASSLYKVLNKPLSMKIGTVLKISKLLGYNLFNYYADKTQEDKEKNEEKESK